MWRRCLAARRIRDKQERRKDLRNCCHLAKLEVQLKLSCWNAALGPGQSHVSVIVSLVVRCLQCHNVLLQTCSHPTFCMLAYCTLQFLHIKDKNKPSKLTFFFQFFSELSLNVLLQYS